MVEQKNKSADKPVDKRGFKVTISSLDGKLSELLRLSDKDKNSAEINMLRQLKKALTVKENLQQIADANKKEQSVEEKEQQKNSEIFEFMEKQDALRKAKELAKYCEQKLGISCEISLSKNGDVEIKTSQKTPSISPSKASANLAKAKEGELCH